MIDFYYMKLYKIIKTSFLIKAINICQLSNLSININNSIYQFIGFYIPDILQLMIIGNMYG